MYVLIFVVYVVIGVGFKSAMDPRSGVATLMAHIIMWPITLLWLIVRGAIRRIERWSDR